ncbi:SIR2-domain-containing protein [Linderina pennispora]|uniref:SIR2-domain-containing protein n=1 Tax=Linderina pennispora TaxID=61395 RepID=A0A1Y1W2A0_9FUNG|nr:SIR2-domain-containing protein [Linderina pennispora]ORX67376.1 SIR2-domain-containing protein [Linderina pennispora]
MAQHSVQGATVELSDHSEANSSSRKRSESVNGPEQLDKGRARPLQELKTPPPRHRRQVCQATRPSPRVRMTITPIKNTDEDSDEEDGDFGGSTSGNSIIDDTYMRFGDAEKAIIRSEAHVLGINGFIQEYLVSKGISVRSLLDVFAAPTSLIQTLPSVNSLEDIIKLLKQSRRIMVLTGAGVSVSCGIPDFRSPTGIYTRLNDEYGLDDPQQMFDIEYFRMMPQLFYSFAKELFPSNFTPAPSHAFVKMLEDKEKLLRNYTQNIDTLEHVEGIKNVLNCHGSFATATCIKCGYKCDGKDLEGDIMVQRIAYCPKCNDQPSQSTKPKGVMPEGTTISNQDFGNGYDDDEDDDEDDDDYGMQRGVMKPDITFFGEKLPDAFDEALLADREKVDLLLVMGSSLKVAPVSDIMGHLPHTVPQIVINKTPILHFNFDVQLLGDADDIVAYLAHACGWELRHPRVAGQSTQSAEFQAQMPAPIESPPDIKVVASVKDAATPGRVETVEKSYSVPKHWIVFPSAVISGKDLMVANGDLPIRLAIDSSDEEDADSYDSEDDEGDALASDIEKLHPSTPAP